MSCTFVIGFSSLLSLTLVKTINVSRYKAQGGRGGLELQGISKTDLGCKENDIGILGVLRARFFD